MKNTVLSLIALTFLTGCQNDIKSSLGLRKSPPDEFTVITYPPLSVPPKFQLNDKEYYIDNSSSPVSYSIEEQKLISKISLNNHNSNAKDIIDRENNTQDNNELFIDPAKEKDRVSKNLKNGKPVNEGVVKYKEPKSTLDRILGR